MTLTHYIDSQDAELLYRFEDSTVILEKEIRQGLLYGELNSGDVGEEVDLFWLLMHRAPLFSEFCSHDDQHDVAALLEICERFKNR